MKTFAPLCLDVQRIPSGGRTSRPRSVVSSMILCAYSCQHPMQLCRKMQAAGNIDASSIARAVGRQGCIPKAVQKKPGS